MSADRLAEVRLVGKKDLLRCGHIPVTQLRKQVVQRFVHDSILERDDRTGGSLHRHVPRPRGLEAASAHGGRFRQPSLPPSQPQSKATERCSLHHWSSADRAVPTAPETAECRYPRPNRRKTAGPPAGRKPSGTEAAVLAALERPSAWLSFGGL